MIVLGKLACFLVVLNLLTRQNWLQIERQKNFPLNDFCLDESSQPLAIGRFPKHFMEHI